MNRSNATHSRLIGAKIIGFNNCSLGMMLMKAFDLAVRQTIDPEGATDNKSEYCLKGTSKTLGISHILLLNPPHLNFCPYYC